MSLPPAIVWLRQDLRLTDNPALFAAAERGPILALYILDDGTEGTRPIGGASRWWLGASLAGLQRDFRQLGVTLALRRGRVDDVIRAVIAETGAREIHWNRCYEPGAIARDTKLKAALKDAGLTVITHNSASLAEPWTVATGSGGPYRVFTPFWRALCQRDLPGPVLPAPPHMIGAAGIQSESLDDLGLYPTRSDWSAGLVAEWIPGEAGASARLERFLSSALDVYDDQRNRPDRPGTSMLSPYLHFGEISPRQIWHEVAEAGRRKPALERHATSLLRELGWREFSIHLMYHFPTLPELELRQDFRDFPWLEDAAGLKAWQNGQTGYPIVDAGMRQLWQTGWMHNRVRMIVASFLVKDLLLNWREGEAWFWDTLVDADLANNAASWQWVAGSGADAAPYFRVMNPVLQGEKFDPAGDYVRRYVPEVAALPDRYIHQPWTAPAEILRKAGVSLGQTYPEPIIDHAFARRRALDRFAELRRDHGAEDRP